MKDYKSGKIKNGKKSSRQKKKEKKEMEKRNYSILLLKFSKVSVFVFLIGSVCVLAYIFFGYLYTSPYFRIEDIIVNGEKRLSDIEVLNLAKVDMRSNILAVSLKEISSRIEQHPWVDRVSVRRSLPSKIIIDIFERIPVAMVNFDCLYLVDKKSIVFKEVGPEDFFDVPVLTGLESEDLANNGNVSRNLIKKALSIILQVNKRKVIGSHKISEVNMCPRNGLTIFTMEDATQIKLGFGDYEKKLTHLKKIMADLQKKFQKAEYINMTCGEKVYVKLEKMDDRQTLIASRSRKRR